MSFTQQLSDVNFEYDTIMKKNFDLSKFFAFSYHSRSYHGILFRANLKQSLAIENNVRTGVGSCSFYYANDFFKTTNTLKTTGDVKIGLFFNLNKYVKNLSSNVKIRTNYHEDEFAGKIRFFLTKSRYNLTATLDNKYLTGNVLGLLLSRPNEEVGVGAGLSFALEEKQLALYNLVLWYSLNSAKVLLRHKTSKDKFQPGRVAVRVYNKLSEKTDIVLSAERDFAEKEQKVKLGARHRISDNFTTKFKIDSNLNIESSTELQVNPSVQLVFLTRASMGNTKTTPSHIVQNTLPFAFKLTFAEN